mmetsp:Transcript_8437/g.15815  ORF Transcript_8437/g.15815 Transcript_8437/m.15815 type:complete len:264 (-) Transcript_8437:40-831(-)
MYRVMRNENQSVWQGYQFEVVIVLGTSALPLPKKSQDIRMLVTYVLAHKIHKDVFGDAPLHVIGENQFDSTSTLAHAVTLKSSKKDLINTQAMYARGLVAALAFPLMYPAIAQMFHDAPGNPGLRMFPVGESLVPRGTFTFASITRTIVEHTEMLGAICLGVVKSSGANILAPSPDAYIELADGDAIAVIERGESVARSGIRRPKRNWAETVEFGPLSICSFSDQSSEEDESSVEYRQLASPGLVVMRSSSREVPILATPRGN